MYIEFHMYVQGVFTPRFAADGALNYLIEIECLCTASAPLRQEQIRGIK